MHYDTVMILLPLLFGYGAGVALSNHGLRHKQTKAGWTKIEAYFVNRNSSHERERCMESQLEELQTLLRNNRVELTFHRWPAVELHKCHNLTTCMRMRPDCFPTKKSARITHPNTNDKGAAIRGVLGNWCAHLKLLSQLQASPHRELGVDYFFILEDDLIIDTQSLTKSLTSLLQASRHHWPLVAFDTFSSVNDPTKHPPKEDLASGGLPLYSISHAWGYYGAHAWLLDAQHADRFAQFVSGLHTVPVDWVPKVVHPLHLGMMSYQTGSLTQRVYLKHGGLKNSHKELIASCLEESDSDILGRRSLGRSATFYYKRPLLGSLQSEIKEVILLGMHNAGTNPLYKLFHDTYEKGNNIELCKISSDGASCGGVWKHTNPKRLPGSLNGKKSHAELEDAMAMVVVRHPFSQLKSRYEKSTHTWKSLADAWNIYMDGYLNLNKVFKKVVILRYEDLVESPESAMQEVGNKLSLKFPGISDDSWLHSQLREKALQKLNARDYKSNFTKAQLDELCGVLDKGILFQFGYHGCQDSHVTMYDTIAIDNT